MKYNRGLGKIYRIHVNKLMLCSETSNEYCKLSLCQNSFHKPLIKYLKMKSKVIKEMM